MSSRNVDPWYFIKWKFPSTLVLHSWWNSNVIYTTMLRPYFTFLRELAAVRKSAKTFEIDLNDTTSEYLYRSQWWLKIVFVYMFSMICTIFLYQLELENNKIISPNFASQNAWCGWVSKHTIEWVDLIQQAKNKLIMNTLVTSAISF